MEPRLDYAKAAPAGLRALYGLQLYINGCGLDHSLMELVKLRASQLNGCAFCIDMHWKDARAAGETEARLYMLNAWREAPDYTDRERAALEWTEAVTKVSEGHVPDAIFEAVRPHFNDKELVDLTYAIASINAWNRLAISFRARPGEYKPAAHPQSH